MDKRQKKYLKSYSKGVKEFEKHTGRKYVDYGEGRGEPTLDLENIYSVKKSEKENEYCLIFRVFLFFYNFLKLLFFIWVFVFLPCLVLYIIYIILSSVL